MAVSPRGQGMVELALASFAVVTILMLGIYLSEVSYLSLKVQEASAFAMFESTGRRIHDFRNSNQDDLNEAYEPAADLLSGPDRVQQEARRRYRDFNGLSSVEGSPSITQVFTRGSALTVDCSDATAGAGMRFTIPAAPTTPSSSSSPSAPAALRNHVRRLYQNRAGVLCRSSARLSTIRIPMGLAQKEAGSFHENAVHQNVTLDICGLGMAVDGQCDRGYAVLLGDWSLDGRFGDSSRLLNMDVRHHRDNDPVPAAQMPYRRLVQRLFEVSGSNYAAGGGHNGSASEFAEAMERIGKSHHNERQFYFSYAGPEHNRRDVDPSDCVPCHFNTNGTATVEGPLGHPHLERQGASGDPLEDDPRNWTQSRRNCFLGGAGRACEWGL